MCKPILFLLSVLPLGSFSQTQDQKVYTSDISNFWIAYDSIRNSNDSLQQIHLIQTLYIDKGTAGLKAFMFERNYSPQLWIRLIKQYPKFWNSVRPNTIAVSSKIKEIESGIQGLHSLYPTLRPATIYFTIGGLSTGGTTRENMVLIGAEITTADATIDASEFQSNWLPGVFSQQDSKNLVSNVIHEYVHTQQNGSPADLLSRSIKEGAADFITELVKGSPLPNIYLQYGRQHEAALKESFKHIMYTDYFDGWLYEGVNADTVADLGYFMGYSICKSYYDRAENKKKAIKEIIELNYSKPKAVEKFLEQSNYYTEKLNKNELIKNFPGKRPYVVGLEPFANGDTTVNASLKEMKIIFSEPMNRKRRSINYGEKGKDFSPITGIVGFSADRTSFTLKLDLKPGHEYEFDITDRSFRSAQGYPLKPLLVKFKTK